MKYPIKMSKYVRKKKTLFQDEQYLISYKASFEVFRKEGRTVSLIIIH